MAGRVFHIIVAAGSGSRYGSALPKQFLEIGRDRPMLMATLEPFMSRPGNETTLVVLSEPMIEAWQSMCSRAGFTSPTVVAGGATRHQSVARALGALPSLEPGDVVTVHDGARPVVTDALIDAVVAPVVKGEATAVIPVVSVNDSLREDCPDGTTRAVDRSRYHAVQTPQAFDAGGLVKAFELPETPSMTDEATVMEMAGHRVVTVEGDPRNIKITRQGDLEIARLYLSMK